MDVYLFHEKYFQLSQLKTEFPLSNVPLANGKQICLEASLIMLGSLRE